MPKMTTTPPGRLPPQNIEAEQSLLGAMLIENGVIDEVADILVAGDFYRSAHGQIYGCIIELHEKREPVDLVTLTNLLQKRNTLEAVGGAVYLASLVNEVPLAVNARHYARIIQDKALLRALIAKGNAIIKHCLDDSEEVDEVIDFAESCLFEIAGKKVKPSVYGVKDLIIDSYAVLEERQKNKGMPSGVATGFIELDSVTAGFQKSDLIILAARPSMGKTALALNITRNVAVTAGIPVVFFSLEMSKEQLVMRLLCAESRVNSARFRDGFISMEDWENLHRAGDRLHRAPIFIDDSSANSALSIRAKTRRLKLDKGIGLIVIDYLQLMNVSRSRERRDLDISEISRSLKGLAKELDIPVVALSQLNRQIERRDDKRPKLSDLRESGAIEQDADLVALIHREEVFKKPEERPPFENKAEVILAKHRNGPTGSVKLTYLKQYSRFENTKCA